MENIVKRKKCTFYRFMFNPKTGEKWYLKTPGWKVTIGNLNFAIGKKPVYQNGAIVSYSKVYDVTLFGTGMLCCPGYYTTIKEAIKDIQEYWYNRIQEKIRNDSVVQNAKFDLDTYIKQLEK